jgi:hypothetical protein
VAISDADDALALFCNYHSQLDPPVMNQTTLAKFVSIYETTYSGMRRGDSALFVRTIREVAQKCMSDDARRQWHAGLLLFAFLYVTKVLSKRDLLFSMECEPYVLCAV